MDNKQHKGNLRGQIKNRVERKLYNKRIRAEAKDVDTSERLLTTPILKCDDLYTLLGVVKVMDYKCPNCGKWHNDNDVQYEVNNEQYPKYFNESKGATMDGSYWDWDEVHCCGDCKTKYWFSNSAY